MGYKIRADAPRALSLPTPVGGGDFSPTATERIYEPDQTIEVITTDIIERFEAGDEHLLAYIEEIVEVDTREVDPTPVPGDVSQPIVQEPVVVSEPVAADPDPTPVEPEPVVAEPVVENTEPVANDTVVGDDEAADNPFTAQ